MSVLGKEFNETYVCSKDESSEVPKHSYNKDHPYLVIPQVRETIQYGSGYRLHESELRVEPKGEQHYKEEERP